MTAPLDDNPTASLEALRTLAAEAMGGPVTAVEPLPGGGSRRRFYRLRAGDATGSRTAVGVIGEELAEVRAFLAYTVHLAGKGIPVPRILGQDAGNGLYVMEDLGDHTLAGRLAQWRAAGNAARAADALETVVRWLPVIQVRGGEGLEGLLSPGMENLDGTVFRGDIRRFRTHFLPRFVLRPAPVDDAVEADLETLVTRLDALPREHFCYRDFQTRNMMWLAREEGDAEGPVFLDYQSGRRGALAYDLTSLLHSPETAADEPLRDRLLDAYLDALAGCGVVPDREKFLRGFYPVVLVRRLQALGAYAELGVTRDQPELLERIPAALADLRALYQAGRFDFGLPALEAWLEEVIG